MDLEARDEHEARPLLGNLGQNKLATAAEKQQAHFSSMTARNFGWHLLTLVPASQFTFMVVLFMVNRFWHHHFIVGHSSSVLIGLGQLLGHEELQAGLAAAARPIDVGIYSVWSSCRVGHLLYQHGVLLPLPGCSNLHQCCTITAGREYFGCWCCQLCRGKYG